MTTPDEMRAMARKLDDMSETWANGGCIEDAEDSARAASMLRSIAEEREVSRQRLSEVADAAIAVGKGPMLWLPII